MMSPTTLYTNKNRELILFLFALTDSTLTCLLLRSLYSCLLNTSQFRVNHDATAVLTNDNLLTHFDVELALGRNLVEATTTSITLYVYNAKSIACVLTDTLERLQQTRFDRAFESLCAITQLLFLLLCLSNDLIELRLLVLEVSETLIKQYLSTLDVIHL